MAPEDKGGTMGYVAPVARKKGKKAKAAKSAKSKADYRPGGMYSTGRAIPPSPGTKKETPKTARRSADAYGSPAKASTRKGALGGLSPVLKAATTIARGVASNIQNKAGDKTKMSMAQAYKAAQKTKGNKK